MSYIGENGTFSFKDGFCEPLADIGSSDIAELGRMTARCFRRIAASGESENQRRYLYAFCSGASECGAEVFLCENADLPSLKYGLPITASECGIYFSGNLPKISFFGNDGFPVSDRLLEDIMRSDTNSSKSEKCGKITSVASLRQLYINSIKDTVRPQNQSMRACISCGNRNIRELWQEFFTEDDDSLIFQISDDGQHVNAYISELGFIPYDKLILASAILFCGGEETFWLPDSFHYAADDLAEKLGISLKRCAPGYEVPHDSASRRFLTDALYMCVSLATDRNGFITALKKLPKFATAKREVIMNVCPSEPFSKTFSDDNGKIRITKSGRNRVTLVAQSYSAETAAELCGNWNEKLRKLSSCKNLFH